MNFDDVIDRLRERSTWIFDLDGTLTIAQHDFAAIRRKLGIAERAPILEALDAMPEPERIEKRRWLDEMEAELAGQAQPADGAKVLLEALAEDIAHIICRDFPVDAITVTVTKAPFDMPNTGAVAVSCTRNPADFEGIPSPLERRREGAAT